MWISRSMFCWIFLILFIETCFGSGEKEINKEILSNVQFSYRSNATVLRQYFGGTLNDCSVECGLRASCYGLNYHRTTRICELLKTDPENIIEETIGWIFVQLPDDLRIKIMRNHCNGADNCANGLRCSQTYVGDKIHPFCQIQECPPPVLPDDHIQISNVSYVGARIGVNVEALGLIYTLQCCPSGIWSENCTASSTSRATGSTSMSTTTSTSLTSSPTSASTSRMPLTSTSTPLTSAVTTASTPTPSSTSTSTSSAKSTTLVTPATTSSAVFLKIDDKAWYVLQSSVETRQLANVTSFNSDKRSWTEAQRMCTANGGMLAHLYAAAETNVVANWVRIELQVVGGRLWMGGKHIISTNSLEWVNPYNLSDTKTVDLALINPNALPNHIGTCLQFDEDNRLNLCVCDEAHYFLCEREYTDIYLKDDAWFTVGSGSLSRQVAYVKDYHKRWSSAQKVCAYNGATMVHLYEFTELDEVSVELELKFGASEVEIWTGGTSDPERKRWIWSIGDPATATVEINPDVWGRFTPDPGTSDNCVLLNKVPGTAELKPGVCTEKKRFMCQRNIGKMISDASWFILEGPERRRVAVVTEQLDWISANKTCEMNGARLAHVYDQGEMNSVRDNPLVSEGSLWVGGIFIGSVPQEVTGHYSSEWFWVGGTSVKPIDPSLWKDGLPPSPGLEDSCTVMEKKNSDFQLINRVCADLLPFLCQKGL